MTSRSADGNRSNRQRTADLSRRHKVATSASGVISVTGGKLTDQTLETLIVRVAGEAIANSGVDPKDIDEIYLGQFNSGMQPLGFTSSLALQLSEELANVPATRTENACASGSAAFQQGVKAVLAGTARNVLVIGAEKMTDAGADIVGAALLGASVSICSIEISFHRCCIDGCVAPPSRRLRIGTTTSYQTSCITSGSQSIQQTCTLSNACLVHLTTIDSTVS